MTEINVPTRCLGFQTRYLSFQFRPFNVVVHWWTTATHEKMHQTHPQRYVSLSLCTGVSLLQCKRLHFW